MKRYILTLITFLFAIILVDGQTITINYRTDEGKTVLTLNPNDDGFLYKPLQEDAYYLYTNAERILFTFGTESTSLVKSVTVEKQNNEKDVWPVFIKDGKYTKNPNQSFNSYGTNELALQRKPSRNRIVVKDEISIAGQKVYIWNPIPGEITFIVGGQELLTDTIDNIKVGEKIDWTIEARKKGEGIILKSLSLPQNGSVRPITGNDEITQKTGVLSGRLDTIITKKTAPFDIVLDYQILDGNCQLQEQSIKFHVDIIKSKGWIVWVCIGGAVLLALIALFFSWLFKRRKKGKDATNVEPHEDTAQAITENEAEKVEESEIEAKDKSPETVESAIAELNEKLSKAEKDLQDEQKAHADTKSELASSEEKLNQKNQELDTITSDRNAKAQRIKELDGTVASLNEQLSQKESDLATAKKEIAVKDSELTTANQELVQVKNEAEKSINEVKSQSEQAIRMLTENCNRALQEKEKQCREAIEENEQVCRNKISETETNCAQRIAAIQEECDGKLTNWKADKDSFLSQLVPPILRLLSSTDEINRNIDEADKAYEESFSYIVSNLGDFYQKAKEQSAEDGSWRKETNAQAEESILTELTWLLQNNSSWINTIARLYCYSRVREIGDIFEQNDVRCRDIEKAYLDMVSLLGRYGITIIVPRILVDFYNDELKQYYTYNNEDIIITRFTGRNIIVSQQAPLRIFDLGRVAYYLDGQITKGVIVHY